MKKLFALIATSLTLSGLPASAIVGGPWDNNNFNQQNTGTYQATMYITNGLGMVRFTDDTNAQFALVNQSIVFYRGVVYVGGAFGSVDWTGGNVTCITNGDTINNFVDSGVGQNIDRANTMWVADIKQKAPVLRFSGDGQANFYGDPNQFDSETTTSREVIIGDTEIQIDTSFQETGGENDDFTSSAGHQTKIYVFGSQISTTTNNQLGVATGAGAGGVGGSTSN
jgi:hypothetical protein